MHAAIIGAEEWLYLDVSEIIFLEHHANSRNSIWQHFRHHIDSQSRGFQMNKMKSFSSALRRGFSRSAVLIAAVGLSGCLATGNQPATQRGAFGVPQGAIETAGIDYLKNEQTVIVGAFKVGFAQKIDASARGGTLFGTDTQSAAMTGTLQGVDPQVFQAITDAAYADFIKKLRATGLKVIETSDLQASPTFTAMKVEPSPQRIGDSIFYAPTGMKLTLFPGDTGVSSAFAGFDTSNPLRVFPQLAKEQNAGVMNVTYNVDFLNASSSGNNMVMGASAEVSMGQGISVRAGSGIDYSTLAGVKCVGYCPNAVSSIDLGQAVYSIEPYGVSKNVTAAGVNTLGVLSGLLTGSGFSRKDIEIQADPARYQSITTGLLEKSNTLLTEAVQKAR